MVWGVLLAVSFGLWVISVMLFVFAVFFILGVSLMISATRALRRIARTQRRRIQMADAAQRRPQRLGE